MQIIIKQLGIFYALEIEATDKIEKIAKFAYEKRIGKSKYATYENFLNCIYLASERKLDLSKTLKDYKIFEGCTVNVNFNPMLTCHPNFDWTTLSIIDNLSVIEDALKKSFIKECKKNKAFISSHMTSSVCEIGFFLKAARKFHTLAQTNLTNKNLKK